MASRTMLAKAEILELARPPAEIFRMVGADRQRPLGAAFTGMIERGDELEGAPRVGEGHRQRRPAGQRRMVAAELRVEAGRHVLPAVERGGDARTGGIRGGNALPRIVARRV